MLVKQLAKGGSQSFNLDLALGTGSRKPNRHQQILQGRCREINRNATLYINLQGHSTSLWMSFIRYA